MNDILIVLAFCAMVFSPCFIAFFVSLAGDAPEAKQPTSTLRGRLIGMLKV